MVKCVIRDTIGAVTADGVGEEEDMVAMAGETVVAATIAALNSVRALDAGEDWLTNQSGPKPGPFDLPG